MTERLLYERLRSADSGLADDLDTIYREAIEIWKQPYLAKFPDHGQAHFDQVEKNLDALTSPLSIPLEPAEIFVLLASCYLHDIGMQASAPDARERHAQYTYELILHSSARIDDRERKVSLSFPDVNSQEAVAKVARAHWSSYALNLAEKDYIVGVEEGRLRLLGGLLATGDLLDLSPVRASEFLVFHKLMELPPVQELHQVAHTWVKGFRICAPNAAVPGDLQFQVEWRGEKEKEELWDLVKWRLWPLNVYWRQLAPLLHESSGGSIRWSDRWVTCDFDDTGIPLPKLSAAARRVLRAERAEQERLDREEFVDAFKKALESNARQVFQLPSDLEWDGRRLAKWCAAYAETQEQCSVASLLVSATDPVDLTSMIAIVLKQWGGELPQCSEPDAREHLRTFVASREQGRLLLVVNWYPNERLVLEKLLADLFHQSSGTSSPGRLALVLIPSTSPSLSLESIQVNATILRAPMPRKSIEEFVGTFKSALESNTRQVFQLPSGVDWDGRRLADWCAAYAKTQEQCFVARLAISPAGPVDLASVIASVFEQWGMELPQCEDHDALQHLRTFVETRAEERFLLVVDCTPDGISRVELLMRELFHASSETHPGGRLALVLISRALPSLSVKGVEVNATILREPVPRECILLHLQDRLGYSPEKSEVYVSKMEEHGMTQEPASVELYLTQECGLESIPLASRTSN